jgi:hypothetical protein
MFVNIFPKSYSLWENKDHDKPRMTIWRMRIACWINKVTKTLKVPNTCCFSTATILAWTRLHVTLELHCLTCFRLKATGPNDEDNAAQMWLRKGANNTCIKQCRQKAIQAVFLPSIQLPYTSCLCMPDKLPTPVEDSYTPKRSVQREKQLDRNSSERKTF